MAPRKLQWQVRIFQGNNVMNLVAKVSEAGSGDYAEPFDDIIMERRDFH